MNGTEMKAALRSGKRVYGTLIVSTSPRWVDVAGRLNLDFVFIDTEHIAMDRHQLSWMCHGYAGKGLAPVVRIPSPDPYQACMSLDGGAKGIVAPYVETPREVQQLRGAVKYRPLKGQKLQEFLDGKQQLEPELKAYLDKNNQGNMLIINIESRVAMENLDEILKVPDLDGVLIGPHDLSCSLGIPEQYGHPQFQAAVEDIITRARKAGVGAGIHAFYEGSIEDEVKWAAMGANLILHSGDINRFTEMMREDIRILREALGDAAEGSAQAINI